MSGLTNKQKAFVEEYLCDFNATRAAERAGYGGGDNVLGAQGSRLLKNVKIAKRISARLAESAMSADEVLARLADQARANIADFVTLNQETGEPRVDLRGVGGKTRLIKSIQQTAHGVRVELYDAQSALALIGKHHALFVDRQQSLNIDVAALTDEQLERIANGEDPIIVCATSSRSGVGDTAQAE